MASLGYEVIPAFFCHIFIGYVCTLFRSCQKKKKKYTSERKKLTPRMYVPPLLNVVPTTKEHYELCCQLVTYELMHTKILALKIPFFKPSQHLLVLPNHFKLVNKITCCITVVVVTL